MYKFTRKINQLSLVTLTAIGVFACGGNDNTFSNITPPSGAPDPVAPIPAPQVQAFDPDGVLEANIRWTDYGVPHVKADNLESMSYGVGYAFAKDNACILADQIVKYNSQRAKYFGPDMQPGSGDSAHLINDFGFLSLGIREKAETLYPQMSTNSRAMLTGYAQGYNQYLQEGDIDPSCAGQAYVQPSSAVDSLTYSFGVALLPGAANFLGPMFIAAPPGKNPLPTPVNASNKQLLPKMQPNITLPQRNPQEMGSNGWGLGADMTENGMGLVLGNPHFPHTGNLRFWQFQTTIPGFLNVNGGSLMGLPGAVNIGFNENVAWTHTFSTAEHFVVYQLSLDTNDSTSLRHTVDGQARTIYEKNLQIEVAVGGGQTIQLEKQSYYTNYGPMIVVPGNFDWNSQQAFAIKDANLPNTDIIDHWLAMNMADDMDAFKQAFKDYDGVIFNNTMAASKSGEVFYIDDSTVPNLTSTAINALNTNPLLIATKQAAGFTVLPGFISQMDFDGPVPYANAPKYEGSDYVQNSNDSFWLTNAESPITNVSPLYGQVGNQQSLRSRLAHRLLADAAGTDNKFSAQEVEQALLSNRSYLAESVLDDLLIICNANRDQIPSLSDGCDALASFDGTMNADSVGAHVFREFAFEFNRNPQWVNAYDPADPLNTPNGLADNASTVAQLVTAIDRITNAGIALDASLGELQFVEKSLANGQASGEKLAWGGAHNVEGGFNVFDVRTGDNGTLLPRHTYPTLPGTRLSQAAQGYHISYGSSWMMVVGFTEEGPIARGLLSYSQSHNPDSEHFDDQTRLYSSQAQLRPIRFSEADIAANTLVELNISQAQ